MSRPVLQLIKSSGTGRSKIEPNPADIPRCQESRQKPKAMIIKVAQPGYIPDYVNVRARISPNLFTATVKEEDLCRLEADPLVVSLGTPRHLHHAS
jgi:hypothetical protein